MESAVVCMDALEFLGTLPSGCAHACVTSPPYYRLRDYGAEGQIGLEPTVGEYVRRLVAVFREVRRVLRPDGTLWLVVGDTYNGTGGAGGDYLPGGRREGQPRYPGKREAGLKPKDLLGVPWALAFALREAWRAGTGPASVRAGGPGLVEVWFPDYLDFVLSAEERVRGLFSGERGDQRCRA